LTNLLKLNCLPNISLKKTFSEHFDPDKSSKLTDDIAPGETVREESVIVDSSFRFQTVGQ